MKRHPLSPPDCFDVIIVGAGHAGAEAAMAASALNLSALLVTNNIDHIGYTSCNPAIGGLAKGHMVREIDALGGWMGRWTDEAALQTRTLNASKGPAVQATRAQIDREIYRAAVQRDLFNAPGIFLCQGMVDDILIKQEHATGIVTSFGQIFHARHVLLTTGTFLGGRIHIGNMNYPGGRFGDDASTQLSRSLKKIGFELQRFMTCTTPRVHTSSIDFSKMEIQPGDIPIPRFSLLGASPYHKQMPCYLTWTNEHTHEIISRELARSPMYSGAIPGVGPRYCPSIEDKIARFPEKNRHQVFVEPEGHGSSETYPNNIATGLPYEVQVKLLHTISGFEKAHIVRPGYAIEYDIISPIQLFATLETKKITSLWSAGQINGTSGYEEAAAQGLWAMINIAATLRGKEAFFPGREKSYISVLIDDLVTKGTDEPYRMFTSRAEYRLLLRENNADMRLTPQAREIGLISDEQWELFSQKKQQLEELMVFLEKKRVSPDEQLRSFLTKYNENPPATGVPLGELFRRPNITHKNISELWPDFLTYPEAVRKEAEIIFRYSGYVARQDEMVKRHRVFDTISIPKEIEYQNIAGLPLEGIEKLSLIRPATLGQALRIPGITPAALSCIEIYIKRTSYKEKNQKNKYKPS